MPFFFLLVFFFYTLINVYIFNRSRQALPRSKTVRVGFSIIYFFFFSAFIIAMLGRNALPLSIQKILYFPGTVWLGMMMYLFIYFFLTDIIFLFNRIFHFFSSARKQQYRRIQVVSGYILVICLAAYGYYRFNHPQVVEQKIEIAKNAGEYKNLKIAGISDLHLGVTVDRKRLEKYVRLINDQHPDIIVIAGDLIDNNVLPLEKERMWETLNELQAPLGVYFCLGNHEHMSGLKAGMDFLRKTNLHLLIDSVAVIDESIQIIGRDDIQRNRRRKPLKELIKNMDSDLPIILLDHEPYHLEEAEENGIDLQFSGHTHKGQLFPGNLLINRMYELPYGYMKRGNTHYFITSGLGLWGPPFRIGTQSEVVVFDIAFKTIMN